MHGHVKVKLVGSIIRISNDARSRESKIVGSIIRISHDARSRKSKIRKRKH
jgi:hypothetical protein